jgi:hypothetical protein
VNSPRFRIAWLIIAVAIAALSFGAIRGLMDQRGDETVLPILGILPMVSILAVGLLICWRHPGSRPFLLGFEAFGTSAMVFYVVMAISTGDELLEPYLDLLLEPLMETVGRNWPSAYMPTAFSLAAVMLALPQVAFALIGGFLSRKFMITVRISRRPIA